MDHIFPQHKHCSYLLKRRGRTQHYMKSMCSTLLNMTTPMDMANMHLIQMMVHSSPMHMEYTMMFPEANTIQQLQ